MSSPDRAAGRAADPVSEVTREVAAEKARLRPLCIERRDSLTNEEREAAHTAMQEALFSSAPFRAAATLCLYYPMRGEPDVLAVWRRGEALGKRIALPVCGAGHSLSFRLLPGYSREYLTAGPYGTTEPTSACPLLPPEELAGALMLIPGLAFDGAGHRLGYGGGYYDRFLAESCKRGISPLTVGVCYAVCLAPGLPHLPHDRLVRYILTEGGLVQAHARLQDS